MKPLPQKKNPQTKIESLLAEILVKRRFAQAIGRDGSKPGFQSSGV